MPAQKGKGRGRKPAPAGVGDLAAFAKAGHTAAKVAKSYSRKSTELTLGAKWTGFCDVVGQPYLIHGLGRDQRLEWGYAYLGYLRDPAQGNIRSQKGIARYFHFVDRYHSIAGVVESALPFEGLRPLRDALYDISRRVGRENPVKPKVPLPFATYVEFLRSLDEENPRELRMKLLCLVLLIGARRAGDLLMAAGETFDPVEHISLQDLVLFEAELHEDAVCESFLLWSLPRCKNRQVGRRLLFPVSAGPYEEFDVMRLMKKFLAVRAQGLISSARCSFCSQALVGKHWVRNDPLSSHACCQCVESLKTSKLMSFSSDSPDGWLESDACYDDAPLFTKWDPLVMAFSEIPYTTSDFRADTRAKLALLPNFDTEGIGTHCYRMSAACLLKGAPGVTAPSVDRLFDWHIGCRAIYAATEFDTDLILLQRILWEAFLSFV